MNQIQLKAPNLTVALCLAVPFVALVVNALGAAGGTLETGASFFTSYYALGCTLMALPFAARVQRAPEYALAILLFLFISGGIMGFVAGQMTEHNPYDDTAYITRNTLRRAARDILILPTLAFFGSLTRRDVYRVEFDKETFPDHVKAGLLALVREGRGAVNRAFAGMLLVAVGLVLIFLPLATDESTIKGVWWTIRFMLLASIGLLGSSVVIPEVDPVFDD